MANNDNKGTNAMPMHFHPFTEDYQGIGDFVFVPKEVRTMKGTDEYKKAIDEIAEQIKDRVAEETKKYMTVVIRDGENDLNTVGVKLFVRIGGTNRREQDGTV